MKKRKFIEISRRVLMCDNFRRNLTKIEKSKQTRFLHCVELMRKNIFCQDTFYVSYLNLFLQKIYSIVTLMGKHSSQQQLFELYEIRHTNVW